MVIKMAHFGNLGTERIVSQMSTVIEPPNRVLSLLSLTSRMGMSQFLTSKMLVSGNPYLAVWIGGLGS